MLRILKHYESCINTERDQVLEQLDIKYMDYINQLLQQKSFIVSQIQQQYDYRVNVVRSLLLTMQLATNIEENSLPTPSNNNSPAMDSNPSPMSPILSLPNIETNETSDENQSEQNLIPNLNHNNNIDIDTNMNDLSAVDSPILTLPSIETSLTPNLNNNNINSPILSLPNIETNTSSDENESDLNNNNIDSPISFISLTPLGVPKPSALNYLLLSAASKIKIRPKKQQINCRIQNKPEKRFQCTWPHCNKQYSYNSEFTVHMRSHTGEKPYKCDRCLKSFAAVKYRNRHKCKTDEDKQKERAAKLSAKAKLKRFQCDYCVAKFAKNHKLKRHLISMHGIGQKPLPCQHCEKRFFSSSQLKVHMRVHSGQRPYQCNKCMKAYGDESYFKIHYKRCKKLVNPLTAAPVGLVKVDEEQVPCLENVPKKKGRKKKKKDENAVKVPKLSKIYHCVHCNKEFNRNWNMQKHIRYKHTKEKPYPCIKCGKRFNDRSNMNRHFKTCKSKPQGEK